MFRSETNKGKKNLKTKRFNSHQGKDSKGNSGRDEGEEPSPPRPIGHGKKKTSQDKGYSHFV